MSLHHTESPQLQPPHRNEPVVCRTCGRTIKRASRHQRFCSDRCREKGRERTRKAGIGGYTRAPRHPLKKPNESNGLQSQKSGPSPAIYGPADAIRQECFGGQSGERQVTADGVTSYALKRPAGAA